MKNGRWQVVLGFLAAVAAGPASAQLYAGGSFGYSQFKDICDVVAPGVSCDSNDTAWRAFGGYQFNQYFALELGFGDLGATTGTGVAGSFAVGAEEAWDLTGLFTIPVANRLGLLVRFGAHRVRTTVDQQGSFGVLHDAKTGSGFSYGAGAEYSLGKLGVRAEWQRYDGIAGGTVAEADVDVFSVGVLFRF